MQTMTWLLPAAALVIPAVGRGATLPGGPADAKAFTYLAPTPESYRKLADETETALRRDVLGVWFPRTIDNEKGGFHSDFARDWRPTRSGGKFSVFQARMTWIAAQAALRRPDLREQFLPYARHGIAFLADVLWDKEQGGFFWGLDDDAHVSPLYTDRKHLYGMSFCIYGAAAAYQATRDPRALDLAERGFRWIEDHAHDATNGGYYEWLTREGKPILGDRDAVKPDGAAVSGFPVGYKSMNTHIHLLEAFSQLYEAWKDDGGNWNIRCSMRFDANQITLGLEEGPFLGDLAVVVEALERAAGLAVLERALVAERAVAPPVPGEPVALAARVLGRELPLAVGDVPHRLRRDGLGPRWIAHVSSGACGAWTGWTRARVVG